MIKLMREKMMVFVLVLGMVLCGSGVDVFAADENHRLYEVAQMREAKQHSAAAVWEDRAYVIGGDFSTGGQSDSIEVYNLLTRQWEKELQLPEPLRALTAHVYEGNIYTIGGKTAGNGAIKKIYIYNIETESWSQGKSMDIGRSYHTSVLFEDKIYVMGGNATSDNSS